MRSDRVVHGQELLDVLDQVLSVGDLTYAHRIVESRGSVPSYGTVGVRGTSTDVDAIAAQHQGREIEADAFWRWLRMAARRD